MALLMFQVTCLGWLIFRAESLDQLARYCRVLVTDPAPSATTGTALLAPQLLTVTPLLLVHAYQARRGSELAPLGAPLPWRYASYAAVFYLVLLFGDFEGAQFIYFQF